MKIFRALIMIGATLALAAVSHADVKVVQSMTIDNPQIKAAMQSMSPEQRAMMAKMGMGGNTALTIYVSGKKSRIDFGAITSAIVNESTGKATILNRTAHTYSTQPIKSPEASATSSGKATVKATGKSKTLLGHLCREYRVSAGNPAGPGSAVSGDMWVAGDLPRPSLRAMPVGPTAALKSQWSKIPGMPLKMDMTMVGGPMGKTVVHMVAKSVSKANLPAATFAIPAGYKIGPAYPAPMMGGMGR